MQIWGSREDSGLNSLWCPTANGIEEIRMAVEHQNAGLMRLVGRGLSLSGLTFEQAQAWLRKAVPNASEQHEVSAAWHGIDFWCGGTWQH